MEIQTPFITPIAIFDFSEHLPFLRSLYVTEKELMQKHKTGKFDTTLASYDLLLECKEMIMRPEAAKLKEAIEAACMEFFTALGYDASLYVPYIRRFWLNEMKAGTFNGTHSHYGNHFAGCLYVDVPPGSSQIRFHSPKERFDHAQLHVAQYTVFNSASWAFNPTEGQLYLWESWIPHAVPPGEFEGVRRSAALDVVMNPK